jgi:hypothetical protein
MLSLPKRFANQYCVFVLISYFAIEAAHPAHSNLPVMVFYAGHETSNFFTSVPLDTNIFSSTVFSHSETMLKV